MTAGIQIVYRLRLAKDRVIAVRRKVEILTAAEDQQRARRNQGGYHGEFPSVRIVKVDTVTLSGGPPIHGLRTKRVSRTDGSRRLNALINSGNVPSHGAATRN